MNHHFINKISKICSNFQPNGINPLLNYRRMVEGKDLENTFKIDKVTLKQLRETIQKMKSTKSTGIDGLSMCLIKDCLPSVEKSLLNLVNQSIHKKNSI